MANDLYIIEETKRGTAYGKLLYVVFSLIVGEKHYVVTCNSEGHGLTVMLRSDSYTNHLLLGHIREVWSRKFEAYVGTFYQIENTEKSKPVNDLKQAIEFLVDAVLPRLLNQHPKDIKRSPNVIHASQRPDFNKIINRNEVKKLCQKTE
jgi:hypothetical protein